MATKTLPPEQRSGSRGGKFFPALCNIFGILLILAVIVVSLPLTLPQFLGYEIYEVVSGSMDPTIPIGSVVYVEAASPEDVQESDIIAFWRDGEVVMHRVVRNKLLEGEFVTKGDANPIDDVEPVPYSDLIGLVVRHYPMLGRLMTIYFSTMGKVYLLLVALCGVLFNVLAGRMRARQRARQKKSITLDDLDTESVELAVGRKRKNRWVRPVIMTILALIFLGSGGVVLFVMHQYKESDQLYEAASAQYTQTAETPKSSKGRTETVVDKETGTPRDPVLAPISVDFSTLCSVNSDVVGWLYCEGTAIDYPVLHGADNDQYLHHTYDGKYSVSGSILIESDNSTDFSDSNTIIYGHHMKNGSMFGNLELWMDQEYYEEHPVIWLLTPERDYQIVLLSGYHTSAYSDVYTVFKEPGNDLMPYLEKALAQSNFTPDTDVELDPEGNYVVLSTCAYVFDNARYVLHGILIPADTAGGVLLETTSSERGAIDGE